MLPGLIPKYCNYCANQKLNVPPRYEWRPGYDNRLADDLLAVRRPYSESPKVGYQGGRFQVRRAQMMVDFLTIGENRRVIDAESVNFGRIAAFLPRRGGYRHLRRV